MPRPGAQAFALVDYDGNILQSSHVVGVEKVSGPGMPLSYLIELDFDIDPLRTHVSPACQSTSAPPSDRINTGIVNSRKVGVTFFGNDTTATDMRFTIAVFTF